MSERMLVIQNLPLYEMGLGVLNAMLTTALQATSSQTR